MAHGHMTDRNFTIFGHTIAAKPLENALYLASTPIGNLADVTIRVLEALAAADIIACEDTRVSAKLLRHFAIRTKTVSYHEHNAAKSGKELLQMLADGKSVVLISDAGTPLVSDPGHDLVQKSREADIKVIPLPGASAPLAALVASGLPNHSWTFCGFVPTKSGQRQTMLRQYAAQPETLVFFESPNRIATTLGEMAEIFGSDRQACVAREITKMHETLTTAPLEELARRFAAAPTKGEIVILVEPVKESEQPDPDTLLTELLQDHPVSAAAAQAAELTGISKRKLYRRALELKDLQ